MKRYVLGGACAAAMFFGGGCATGMPAGGRSHPLTARWRPYSRPAAPRTVPGAPDVAAVSGVAAAPKPVDLQARARALEVARGLVGKRQVHLGDKRYPDDCTGFVAGVLDQVGLEVLRDARRGDNAVTAIYRYAQRNGRIYEGGHPLPGDLVFFRETYDRNRDGRSNDGLTHLGFVDDVEEDGTILVIHRVARGVVRYRMNLANPDLARDPKSGRVLNDHLRHAGPGQRDVLTGQLFAAFATVLPSPGRQLAQR